MSKKVLINLARILFYGALLYFLGRILLEFDWHVIQSIDVTFGFIFLASTLALTFRFLVAAIWQSMLTQKSRRMSSFERLLLFNAYSVSWVSRYFPGGLISLGSRVYLSSRVGFKAFEITATSILEVLFQVVALVVITILFLGGEIAFFKGNESFLLLISAVAVSVFVLMFPVLCDFIDTASKKLVGAKTSISVFRFSRVRVFCYLIAYILASVVVGVSYYLILCSIYGAIQLDVIFFVIGVVSFSSLVSIFSIFAPGGIGVREGILVLLLIQIVPKEIAISLAVISRLLGVFLDVLFFFLVKVGLQSLKYCRIFR